MKALRIASYLTGLAAVGLTIYQVIQIISAVPNWSLTFVRFLFWDLLYLWPDWLFTRMRFMIRSPDAIDLVMIAVYLLAVVISIALAITCNRSPWDWGILALLFPYLATVLLPFQSKKLVRTTSAVGQVILWAFTGNSRNDSERIKFLKRITLAVGIAGLIATAYDVIMRIMITGDFDIVRILLYWPERLAATLRMVQFNQPWMVLTSPAFYEVLTVYFGGVFFSLALAKALNRPRADWGVVAVFLPYFSCSYLGMSKRNWESSKGIIGTILGSFSSASPGGGGFSVAKTCSRCGKSVSAAARAGQRCPHCGAYWSSEKQR